MSTFKKALKTLLHKAFDIREGEYRTALLMQFNIFLLISTLLIVKPNINALFLSRFGAERLPEAFVAVALTALLFSRLYTRLLNKRSFNLIIERTLLISFLIMVLFLVLLKVALFDGPVLYLFYIWVAVFALLATSQFWVLANLVYNIREAKRLFSFIGAGAISGGIFGGYLTLLLAPVIGSENVLFVAASFLLICIPVTRFIWKENVSNLSVFRQKKRVIDLTKNPVKLIMNSRHLMYLAGIIGVSVMVAKFVDYQFSDIAHRNIEDADELAAFFGFWFSNLNLISLFIQLFFTPRVVGFWGVGTSLLFLPFGILAGAVVLLLSPGLAAAILIKVADGSFKQSINKSAVELLGLPIPLEIKNRTKTFIDVVVDSVATGLAGFILIFIVNGLQISTRYVSVVIILLIGLWIYLVLRVRNEYIKSFRTELKSTTSELEPLPLLPVESVIHGIESILKTGSEEQILFMLKKIREIENNHLFESIRNLLHHSSARVRAEAINTLYQYRSRPIVEEIKPFVHDPDNSVKLEAFEYLFEHAAEETIQIFDRYLDHQDQHIANAALLSLAIEMRNNQVLKELYNLGNRIRQRIDDISPTTNPAKSRDQKRCILEVIGHADMQEFFYFINQNLEDHDPEVVRVAIYSAGLTLNPMFIDSLVSFLGTEKFREIAKSTLFGFSTPIIDRLAAVVELKSSPKEVLVHIPSVIEQFDSQHAVNTLMSFLYTDDLDLRLEAVRSLSNLKVSSASLTIHKQKIAKLIMEEGLLYLNTLSAMYAEIIVNFKNRKHNERKQKEENARLELIDILEHRLDNDLELIFGLLDLKYPAEDINATYRGIQSENPERRNNAIEFLDNLLETDLKRVLIPIVETTILDSISEDSLRSLSFKIPAEKECFEILLSLKDRRIKLALLNLIREMGDQRYLPLVEKYINNHDPELNRLATAAFQRLSES